jgi:hypothetical protein
VTSPSDDYQSAQAGGLSAISDFSSLQPGLGFWVTNIYIWALREAGRGGRGWERKAVCHQLVMC